MRFPSTFAGVLAAALVGCAPASSPEPMASDGLPAIMQAEDRRAGSEDELEVMRAGTRSAEAPVRAVAARGMGRLERPELVPELVALLGDEEAEVRRQAAFGIGQATGSEIVGDVTMPLYLALSRDADDDVRAAAAHALGRLPYDTEGLLADAWQALYSATLPPGDGHGGGAARAASPTVTVGIVRGMEALARRNRGRFDPPEEIVGWLEGLVSLPAEAPLGERLRPLAMATLAAGNLLDTEVISAGVGAPDVETRRRAAGHVAGAEAALQRRALSDEAATVRVAALQSLRGADGRCQPALDALGDTSPQVRIEALALLSGCPEATAVLHDAAASLTGGSEDWQPGATAMQSLAGSGALDAELLTMAADHEIWQVRMYAARSADAATIELLETLAEDPVANVRHAAIERLGALIGRAADPYLVSALAADDPQLVMAAANLLEGSTSTDAVPAGAGALERFTARRRLTDRDARMALLERLDALGAQNDLFSARLTDFDPVVASRAAEILSTRMKTAVAARPGPMPALHFPELDELERLEDARFRVHMARGGSFTLRLLPFEAPTSAARFARMASDGLFDGLTFHRVVANFVIQGGSPGANEYAGHGEFTRDEISDRSHLRGTVGISTRGRDTGDGQIFVNLVDNYRLDGDYTILAEVIEGMAVVDAVLEGDVITRVEVVERP